MNYSRVVEECKKLEYLVTFSTPDKLHKEIMENGGTIFGGTIYNLLNPVGVSGDNYVVLIYFLLNWSDGVANFAKEIFTGLLCRKSFDKI